MGGPELFFPTYLAQSARYRSGSIYLISYNLTRVFSVSRYPLEEPVI